VTGARSGVPTQHRVSVDGSSAEAETRNVAGIRLTVFRAGVPDFDLISLDDAMRLAEAVSRDVAEQVCKVTSDETARFMRLSSAAHGDVGLAEEAYRRVASGELSLDLAVEQLANRAFVGRFERFLADHPVDESTRACCLYFARSHRGFIKIGISAAPADRIKELSTASGSDVHHDVELLAFVPYESREEAREREAALHRQFSYRRIRGEWFADSQELRDEIARLVAAPAPAPQVTA